MAQVTLPKNLYGELEELFNSFDIDISYDDNISIDVLTNNICVTVQCEYKYPSALMDGLYGLTI